VPELVPEPEQGPVQGPEQGPEQGLVQVPVQVLVPVPILGVAASTHCSGQRCGLDFGMDLASAISQREHCVRTDAWVHRSCRQKKTMLMLAFPTDVSGLDFAYSAHQPRRYRKARFASSALMKLIQLFQQQQQQQQHSCHQRRLHQSYRTFHLEESEYPAGELVSVLGELVEW